MLPLLSGPLWLEVVEIYESNRTVWKVFVYDWNAADYIIMYYCIVEVNDTQRRMSAQYIYLAPISGANGYIQKTQYNKLQTINKTTYKEYREYR